MNDYVDLLLGSFGCPCGRHVRPDPYPDPANWHEAARGDGGSYSGVVETLHRQPGETDTAFLERAQARGAELSECDR